MGFAEQSKLWFLKIFGLPRAAEIEKKYKKMLEDCMEGNRIKTTHIKTLEDMLKDSENRHIEDMKNINLKLDKITRAFEAQNLELKAITKELLYQKEEAKDWRLRLEELMEMTDSGPAVLSTVTKKAAARKKK